MKLAALVAVAVLALAGCSSTTPAVKSAATPTAATQTPWREEAARLKAARKAEEDQAKVAADLEAQRIRGEAPAFEVVDTSSGDYLRQNMGGAIRVTVDRTLTEAEADSIMNVLMLDYPDPGGYFVSINCSTGGTDKADHRLANGKIALGRTGQAKVGFTVDGATVDLLKGATCP